MYDRSPYSPTTDNDDNSSSSSPPSSPGSPKKAAKDKSSKKRATRRTWNHALEKHIFNPHEIATLGAPHRRTIYLASIEGHIDRLHSQLHSLAHYPVHPDALSPYKGLNCKTAKGMVAGLQHDIVCARKFLQDTHKSMDDLRKEYEEAREAQRNKMQAHAEPTPKQEIAMQRKFSLDSSVDYHARHR